jgi:hypothetical protein
MSVILDACAEKKILFSFIRLKLNRTEQNRSENNRRVRVRKKRTEQIKVTEYNTIE